MRRKFTYSTSTDNSTMRLMPGKIQEDLMVQRHTLKEMKKRGFTPDDVVGFIKYNRIYRQDTRDGQHVIGTEIIFDEEVIFSF